MFSDDITCVVYIIEIDLVEVVYPPLHSPYSTHNTRLSLYFLEWIKIIVNGFCWWCISILLILRRNGVEIRRIGIEINEKI